MAVSLKIILGILGNATAILLFAAPVSTFWRIIKKRSTEEFSGLPYVCTLFNCMLWVFYGMPFVKPNSLLIITINVAGCAIEASYLIIYVIYAPPHNRMKVLKMLAAVAASFALVASLTLSLVHGHSGRTTIVGSLCVIVAVAMYVSPLGVMRRVIQTRSVEYMPFLLSLFVFINSLIWTFYAIVTRDIFIAIPNGLGVLAGILQLSIYAFYRNAKPKDVEMGEKPKTTNDTHIQMEDQPSKQNDPHPKPSTH